MPYPEFSIMYFKNTHKPLLSNAGAAKTQATMLYNQQNGQDPVAAVRQKKIPSFFVHHPLVSVFFSIRRILFFLEMTETF